MHGFGAKRGASPVDKDSTVPTWRIIEERVLKLVLTNWIKHQKKVKSDSICGRNPQPVLAVRIKNNFSERERARDRDMAVDTSDRNHKCHPVGMLRMLGCGNPHVVSIPVTSKVTCHLFYQQQKLKVLAVKMGTKEGKTADNVASTHHHLCSGEVSSASYSRGITFHRCHHRHFLSAVDKSILLIVNVRIGPSPAPPTWDELENRLCFSPSLFCAIFTFALPSPPPINMTSRCLISRDISEAYGKHRATKRSWGGEKKIV